MKIVLVIAAVVSLLGTICEKEKGYWIALFAISVLAYIAISVLGV